MTARGPLEAAAAEVLSLVDDLPLDHAREMIRQHRDAAHSSDLHQRRDTCIRCRIDEAFKIARRCNRAYLLARAEEIKRAGYPQTAGVVEGLLDIDFAAELAAPAADEQEED